MYQVTKLLENEKKDLKYEWKTKLWDGNTVKKEPSRQMVQRPVLGRVEKAILKEIDFYGEKKHIYPYKK